MCESQRLILAIKKYPCLWNIYDEDYRKREVKDLAWEQVFKHVIKEWNTCTKEDKENKVAEVKRKWTHIRDYYRRGLQKQSAPTGTAGKKVKKYIYADLLNFLAPIFDESNAEENHETDDLEMSDSQEWEPKREDELYVEEEDDHTGLMQPSSPVSPAYLEDNKEDNLSQILSILNRNQNNQVNQEVEDDDTKFLLSFRTYMKHMDENQKIEFKLGMLHLVKRINAEYR